MYDQRADSGRLASVSRDASSRSALRMTGEKVLLTEIQSALEAQSSFQTYAQPASSPVSVLLEDPQLPSRIASPSNDHSLCISPYPYLIFPPLKVKGKRLSSTLVGRERVQEPARHAQRCERETRLGRRIDRLPSFRLFVR
ncbi:hypothetical protein L202_05050 [Cryptococcus amylolentus CBS 6039]|uniref:Uncharacterized protein n=1 Tax=Cryptococcus amylolentus CBS 6039 TaxID=1295533 RepID=A0A1E3HP87_9TREE|nr:hypothetical protein L202_05050 [Cryptococcus amylolentus CBS 6039]ODN77955.1 hypothetical protein L202_05050 [Cryptococcus amylolentus CBS 6039]